MSTKEKKKQKPKPGKVIRLRPKTWELVTKKKKKGETIADTIQRLIGLDGAQTFFILPESKVVLDGAKTLAEARGAAILFAVKKKKATVEQPIAVRVIA